MKAKPDNLAPAAVGVLQGYSYIKDDGDCQDHGFFLPKQTAAPLMKSVCNSGVSSLLDVQVNQLCAALAQLGKSQKARLAATTSK